MALDFYNKLFGWTLVSDMDMQGQWASIAYSMRGEHHEMGDGGMMTEAPPVPVSCWEFLLQRPTPSAQPHQDVSRRGGGKIFEWSNAGTEW